MSGSRRVLATLSLTVTVSYGVLIYAYPVLLRPMERDLGWTRGQTSAALSIKPSRAPIIARDLSSDPSALALGSSR